jgi:hypothetical protein
MTPLSVEANGFYKDFTIQRNAQQQQRGLCPQKLFSATTVALTLGIVQEMCSIGIRCVSWGTTLKITSRSEGHTYFSFCCCILFFRTFLKKNIWEQQPKNWCMLTSGVMGMGWGREAILLGSKIITHNHLSIQKEKVWTRMDSQMESLYLVLDMDLAMMLQRN